MLFIDMKPLKDIAINASQNQERRKENRSQKMRVSHETIYQWIFADAKQGGLATHAERKNRYLVAEKVVDKRSDTFMKTSIKCFKHRDPELIKTFTADNGSEFYKFKDLENVTASKIYFADPYAPWQRGLNENTNGLLRRFFPKGCNFHKISDKVIQQAVEKLNHQPKSSTKKIFKSQNPLRSPF